MNYRLEIKGANEIINKLAKKSEQAFEASDKITEAYARKMANDSAGMAPVDKGALQASIASSPKKLGPALWQYGSDLPYARRQEYEHKSKKGFIRKSVYTNESQYIERLKKELGRWG